jgi:hypothetical protein
MKFTTHDINEIKTGRVVICNAYWLCKDGDTKQAIFYGSTAQCNKNRSIPDRLKAHTEKKTGWKVEVVYVEIAFRPPQPQWV